MKRVLVLFLFIACIVGSIYAWMLIRPTPTKLFKTALHRLTLLTSTQLQGSVQWETADEAGGYHFGGWTSYAGIVDLHDLSAIRANGMIGYSSTPNKSDFQTVNAILTPNQFGFQEKQVSEDFFNQVELLAGTTTTPETWFSIDRLQLFKKIGYVDAIPKGSNAEIRTALRNGDLSEWMTITSSTEQIYGGREYMTIHFTVKQDEMVSGLLSLIAAWKHLNPAQADIIWSKQIAKNASKGDWIMVIDEQTKDIATLTGWWKIVNDQDRVTGRASLSLAFGVGGDQALANPVIPKDAINLTQALFQKKAGFFPSASDRPTISTEEVLENASSSTTGSTSTSLIK